MPIIKRTNNNVLAANARASDVAEKTIQEILPAQQQRYYDAFRVQGYQAILYNRLEQGLRCTCQSSQKALNTRLGEDGKASKGLINQMITGSDRFDVTPYDANIFDPQDPFSNITSPHAPGNQHQGTFDLVANKQEYNNSDVIDGIGYGDNGPIDPSKDIETLFGDWDGSNLGFTDVACSVCFGTGFVGGFAPFHASRQVFAVNSRSVELGDSILDASTKPWQAQGNKLYVTCTFPLGALSLDTCRLMQDSKQLPAVFTVDGTVLQHSHQIMQFCDGKPHVIEIKLPDDYVFTHFELQFNLTNESAYFEFPRLKKSSDLSRLEQLEPFQLILSPNIPSLKTNDVIVESTFGKVLVVQNSDWWNTRNRNVLGWECTVRVIEPMERYRILPKRGRTKNKNETTNIQHDNVRGTYRT